MANYSAYIPAVGSTTYPTQISNFITISEAMDTEIEIARDGQANLLANIDTKLNLTGGTLSGALTISSGNLTVSTGNILINSNAVAVKDGTMSNGVLVSGDSSGRITTSSGIVATNIATLSGIQTITGNKTFSGTNIISGVNTFTSIPNFNGGSTAGLTPPFTVDSTEVVIDLNADLLDGAQGSLYARLASPTFTGNPTAPTQSAGDNDTSIATTAFVLANVGSYAFPAGTKMLFQQTSAPTGWTKQTTHNNKALRVVSGTASSGGSVTFTTAFASKSVVGTVGNTSLTIAQMPSHVHNHQIGYGGSATITRHSGQASSINQGTINTGSAGSGSSHTHSFSGTAIDMAVQYVDLIIAQKN